MTFAEWTLRWQRWLLAAMVFGSAVIIVPPIIEPFMLPKVTFMVVLAAVLAALGAARALWTRQVHLPAAPVSLAAGAFALALLITTVLSPTPLASVIGFYSRYTGLVPYLTYLLVFFLTWRLADLALVRLLSRTLLVALGLVLAYGFLQAAGGDPYNWNESLNGTTFSFLGNVDFSSAWSGSLVGLLLVTGSSRAESRAWRLYAWLLLPLTVSYLFVTDTVQGLAAAALAGLTTAVVLKIGPGSSFRAVVARRPRAAAAVAVSVGLVLATGAVASLIAFREELASALVDRPEFWAAALGIFVDHPVVGTGLDTYAHSFLAYRPANLALSDGPATTDAPHSVLLGMFSNGGLVLGLSYVAVVGLVGYLLVRGAWSVNGAARLPFAGFAGLWVAYQAQSAVSFDVPPLALLHWMSAAVIVALAGQPAWRELTLPGHRPLPTGRKAKKKAPHPVAGSTRAGLALLGVAVLGVTWLALYPLRADLIAASSEPLARSGQLAEAAERLQRAGDLNPAEASYRALEARVHDAADRHAEAYTAAVEAAQRDTGTVQYPLFAASQAEELGREQEAAAWYRNAVRRDPFDPPVLNAAASFFLNNGQPEQARDLAGRVVALRPDVDALLILAAARENLQQPAAARDAYEAVLRLEPDNARAADRLAELEVRQ
jgi:O-antigen ligase/Tfp pilus assembly protein PilF